MDLSVSLKFAGIVGKGKRGPPLPHTPNYTPIQISIILFNVSYVLGTFSFCCCCYYRESWDNMIQSDRHLPPRHCYMVAPLSIR